MFANLLPITHLSSKYLKVYLQTSSFNLQGFTYILFYMFKNCSHFYTQPPFSEAKKEMYSWETDQSWVLGVLLQISREKLWSWFVFDNFH